MLFRSSHLLIGLTSVKVRQKHSESFPELITEYGKGKRHSVEEMVKNDCVGIFGGFDANLPGKRKWEQVDSERTSNKCDGARVAGWQAFAIKDNHFRRERS